MTPDAAERWAPFRHGQRHSLPRHGWDVDIEMAAATGSDGRGYVRLEAVA